MAGGGQLVFVATRIQVRGSRYAITVSVTNRSQGTVHIHVYPPQQEPSYMVRGLSFGIAYREAPNPNITTRHLINIRAATFAPGLPQELAPGQTWRGTFSGQSPILRKHRTWWIAYGQFFPGGYWLSDKTFST